MLSCDVCDDQRSESLMNIRCGEDLLLFVHFIYERRRRGFAFIMF